MDSRSVGSWSIRYTAIIELATIRFGCSEQKFGRRIGIGLFDKRQCSGQDPRRIIAWGYSYIILVTM